MSRPGRAFNPANARSNPAFWALNPFYFRGSSSLGNFV